MADHRVRTHLHVEVEEYDAAIRRFIPGYETMLERAADVVLGSGAGTVLDLGAGTGALSEVVLARGGEEVVVALDVDPEMLEVAHRRLVRFGSRARFSEASFLGPLPACDAVMASLSLHHVPSPEEKREVYHRIAEALPPGGVFVNADVTMPEVGEARDRAWRGWADHLVASGIAEADAWRHFEEWAGEDTYFPVALELRLMGEAGLDARQVWSDGVSTLLVGTKIVSGGGGTGL